MLAAQLQKRVTEAMLRVAVYCVLAASTVPAADITGLWYGPPAGGNNKPDLWLAVRVQGDGVTGEVESPTRNSRIVDAKVTPDGFSGIAQSDWDGKLARRP